MNSNFPLIIYNCKDPMVDLEAFNKLKDTGHTKRVYKKIYLKDKDITKDTDMYRFHDKLMYTSLIEALKDKSGNNSGFTDM